VRALLLRADRGKQVHDGTLRHDDQRFLPRPLVLIFVAFVAGIIAGISPCILPVLPVVFFAGAAGETLTASEEVSVEAAQDGEEGSSAVAVEPPKARTRWQLLRRPVAIVAGLVVSFTLLVLVGAEVLSLFHLPDELLRDLGIAMLFALGIGFLIPAVGELLERPFARLSGSRQASTASGFIIGLALGLVFVPCAGPVLATITVLGATHHVSFETFVIAVFFGLGAGVPLLFVALAGDRLVARSTTLRTRAPLLRRIGGVAMILVALGVALNSFDALQRSVPGYTSALQRTVEGSGSVRQALDSLKGSTVSHELTSCPEGAPVLVECGQAPQFTGVTKWLDTAGDHPLSTSSLRGHVVLIDFWTYSCINCQRAIPHVEAWYDRYKNDGLVVVGVHTPEFAFEHSVPNIEAAAKSLGVTYPIAVDDDYATWNAYANEYWPAEYLIDSSGNVRHVDFGEGGYTTTEDQIRSLLVAAHPGLVLPPPTNVPDRTPQEATNPETYIGSAREVYLASPEAPVDRPLTYVFPSSLTAPEFALSGTWQVGQHAATALSDAALELGYQATDIYLVLGGTGTITIDPGNGQATRTLAISGFPRLYTLLSGTTLERGVLTLHFSPGVQAYAFTFG